MRSLLIRISRRRRLLVALQLAFLAALLAFLTWALRDVWADAAPRLRDADPVAVAIALAALTAYYLAFVVGWQAILRALGIHVSYAVALQAEMASMLAKYVPGGVWTPAARVVWLRKAGGVEATSVVVSSILLEAGLSAIAGVLVFLGGLLLVDGANAPLVPLLVFAAVVAGLLHPRVFRAIAGRVFEPFGGAVPPPLRWRTMLGLLAYYSLTWLMGGTAILFLLRSVGGDPPLAAIPYLGGVGAVGAIVAVLSILAPSGLGVREATMYGLMLAVAAEGVALGASVLNRLAITVVEAVLLAAGILAWRLRKSAAAPRPVPTTAER